jgi:hypothetical protein
MERAEFHSQRGIAQSHLADGNAHLDRINSVSRNFMDRHAQCVRETRLGDVLNQIDMNRLIRRDVNYRKNHNQQYARYGSAA